MPQAKQFRNNNKKIAQFWREGRAPVGSGSGERQWSLDGAL